MVRAGNSLIRSLLIRSSLIHSFSSNQLSDFERIVQVTQDKWVTVSESLRSFMTNERPEQFAQVAHDKWANERFAQQTLAKKI